MPLIQYSSDILSLMWVLNFHKPFLVLPFTHNFVLQLSSPHMCFTYTIVFHYLHNYSPLLQFPHHMYNFIITLTWLPLNSYDFLTSWKFYLIQSYSISDTYIYLTSCKFLCMTLISSLKHNQLMKSKLSITLSLPWISKLKGWAWSSYIPKWERFQGSSSCVAY